MRLYRLISKDRRKYGGYIIHIGIACIFLGLSGSPYEEKKTVELLLGESTTIQNYHLRYEKIVDDNQPSLNTHFVLRVNLPITQDGSLKGILKPQREFHRRWARPYARSALYSSLLEDLRVIWNSYNRDNGAITLEITVYPLVNLIWVGAWITVAGTLVALIPKKTGIQDIKA